MGGKEIRLSRLLRNNRMFSVPLDHGVTNGPVGNLKEFQILAQNVINNGASSIIVHKGMIRFLPSLKQTGLIIHLSASTDLNCEVNKVIVCSVEEALRSGADAVSVHVNVGNTYEKAMIKDLAMISSQCDHFGIPLLAMMYVRDDFNVNVIDTDKIMHAVRIAVELGADMVKIAHVDDMVELNQIVQTAQIPIIVAGGTRYLNEDVLYKKTREIVDQGALGVSFGRNIFESPSPAVTVAKISSIIFGT